MKFLLAIDGSEHSHAAVDEVASRDWPGGTEIQVVTVIHSRWPLLPDPSFIMAVAHTETVQDRQHEAPALLDDAAGLFERIFRSPSLRRRCLKALRIRSLCKWPRTGALT
jgi:hypothetical protein